MYSLRFGAKPTIKKSSEEIEKYLQRISSIDFAGAATKQIARWTGKSLTLAWPRTVFPTINDQGAGLISRRRCAGYKSDSDAY